MITQFKGHNYIVVFKHGNKCKIKPFKTLEKANKYFDKKMYKCTYRLRYSVVLMDTMGHVITRFNFC